MDHKENQADLECPENQDIMACQEGQAKLAEWEIQDHKDHLVNPVNRALRYIFLNEA